MPYLSRKIHLSFILPIFAAGLVLSIALESFTGKFIHLSPIWLLVALAFLAINFSNNRLAFFVFSFLAGVILGTFRLGLEFVGRDYFKTLSGQTVELSGIICEDPDIDGSTVILYLDNLEITGTQKVRGTMYVKLSSTENFQRYQKVKLKGKLSDSFAYFVASMQRPELLSLEMPTYSSPALAVRDFFAEKLRISIPAPQVDLALGYLVGQKKSLPSNLEENLRIVGLTHIVVASGYNLFIIANAMRKIFAKISRFAALLFGALLILLFMAIVGFSPSMLRAGAVSLAGLVAWFFGRKFHPIKLILLAAGTTLLFNPNYVQHLGWLLSFGSFVGVMIVSPIFTRYFYGQQKSNFLASTVIETLSAQICCLPLILFYFGSMSALSLFANVLVLPSISLVMLLALFAAASFFLPVLPQVFGFCAEQLLSFHIFVVDYFSNISWAYVEIPSGNPFVFAIYIALIGALYHCYKSTKYRFMQVNMLQ